LRLISKPILCNYYVSYRCNATCSFCDIWERPSPYITWPQVEQNLRDLKRLGVKVIDFTGGEPLLHRQISEILGLAQQMGFLTTLTTNTLLYPKKAEALRGKVDMLHFSLDSPVRAEHDASRGIGCFDFLIQSIDIAKQLGERPDILFTVYEKNKHQIGQVWEEICLPSDLILILNPIFEYNQIDHRGGLSAETLQELSAWGRKKNVYLNEGFIELRKDGGNHIAHPICRAASSTVVISPQNELLLPCYHLGLQSFPIEGRLYELYHSKEIQQLIEMEGRYAACEGCAINCYMQPSFAVEMNKYWWKALPSTLKYNWLKGSWRKLIRK
jgi:MoaA/NifB/PqqE/SkfB family radical SAM enzyme